MRFNVINTYVAPGKYRAKISRVYESNEYGAIYWDFELDGKTYSVPYFISNDCSADSSFYKFLQDIGKTPTKGEELNLYSLLFDEAEVTVIDSREKNKETRSKVVYIRATKNATEETPIEEGVAN